MTVALNQTRVLRILALVAPFALTLLSADPALAACTPSLAAFDANIEVTCVGAETNPVGDGSQSQITVKVQTGASITVGDDGVAIWLDAQNRITNFGSISSGNDTGAGSIGILLFGNDNVVINNGSIRVGDSVGLAAAGIALFGNGNVVINNSSITAGNSTGGFVYGIQSLGDNASIINNNSIVVGNGAGPGAPSAFGIAVLNFSNVVNNGTIIAGNNANAIFLCCNNTATNAAGALIQVGDGSIGIAGSSDNVIVNAGRIVVGNALPGALSTSGIYLTGNDNRVENSGSIVAGIGSTGINTLGDNTSITNSGLISTGANGTGIDIGFGSTGAVVLNSGTIIAGADGIGVNFQGAGTLNNSGTIRALGGTANAIRNCACVSAVVINSGTVDGIIFLDTGGTITNSGLITITATDASMAVGATPHLGGDAFVQTAGGTLALRVTSDVRNDSLGTAAGGSVTLGGTLRAGVQPGLYQPTTTYTNAVTSAVPIAGQFANHVSSSPFFTASANYADPNAVHLILSRIGFASVPGLTQNQRAVGTGLESGYSVALTGNAATFYGNLLAATSIGVLDQLSGQGISGAQHVGFGSASQFNNGMMQQGLGGGATSVTFAPLGYAAAPARARVPDAFAALDATAAAPSGLTRLWTTAFGMTRALDGEANPGNTAQTQRAAGGMFGVDRQIAPDLVAGIAVGGSEGGFLTGLATSGRMTGGHIGGYATKSWGSAYLAAAVSYARFAISTSRTITGIGPTETATGSTSADILAGRIELGWKQRIAGVSVTPFVAVEPAMLWQQGYAEASVTAAGAPGVLGLSLAARSTSSLPAFLGVQIDSVQTLPGGLTLAPFARASWVHEFLADRPMTASPLAVPAASFTVYGASAVRDAARLDAGARLSMTDNVSLLMSATGEFSERSRSYGATASLRATW